MLTIACAAAALVGCQKENVPEAPNGLKSVEISLENLIMTKGDAGTKIEGSTPVQVNDLQFFLVKSNGTFFTGALEADGQTAAQYEFTGALQTTAYVFHYVDTDVNKVVAVANAPADFAPADYEELQAVSLAIAGQQNATDLSLYAEGTLTKTGRHTEDTDADGNVQTNEVYEANLTLVPRVARLEVDGFNVVFGADDPATPETETSKYENINFTQIALVNYMPNSLLWDGTEQGTLVNPLAAYYEGATVKSETDIYTWLDGGKAGVETWTYDLCDLNCTPAEPVKDFVNADNEETPKAYHIFGGNVVPTFFIKLIATPTGSVTGGVPAFLYTKAINGEDKQPITTFQEGYIYRMSGAAETGTDKGAIVIPEDVIDEMDRCLEINVTVVPWQVVLVTPEF